MYALVYILDGLLQYIEGGSHHSGMAQNTPFVTRFGCDGTSIGAASICATFAVNLGRHLPFRECLQRRYTYRVT